MVSRILSLLVFQLEVSPNNLKKYLFLIFLLLFIPWAARFLYRERHNFKSLDNYTRVTYVGLFVSLLISIYMEIDMMIAIIL